MSNSGINRRNMLVQIAAAAAVAGSVEQADAQHVHQAVAATKKGPPVGGSGKAFNAHESVTLRALCELIVPGASKGNAFEFIDLLSSNNADLRAIFTGGLSWLDRTMEKRVNTQFVTAKPADQTALLDLIAFRETRESQPDLGPGVRFFDWARRLTVDAYYTSAAGIREVGFKGNGGMSEFKVPQEAIDYAMKRSGLA